MNARGRSASARPLVALLPALAFAAGCQLVAGLDGITPNDTTSSSGPGGGSSSSSSGAGGGGGGGGGSRPLAAPTCRWVTTVSSLPALIQGQLVAAAADNSSYLGGSSMAGCGTGILCPFFQHLAPGGKSETEQVLPATGFFSLDGLAVVPTTTSGLALSGTVSEGTTITLPGPIGVMLSPPATQVEAFVASLSTGLGNSLWSVQLVGAGANTTRVAADLAGKAVLVASEVDGPTNQPLLSCTVPDAKLFLADLDGDTGSCRWLNGFTGSGDAGVEVLRTSDNGYALLGGGFNGTVTFPSGVMVTGAAAYYGLFRLGSGPDRGVDIWRRKVAAKNVGVLGGSVSPHATHLAVAGSFHGAPPEDLTGKAAVSQCGTFSPANTVAFVKTYRSITSANPTAEIELCLGSTGDTRMDALIDDDGNVTLGGTTTGKVDYGQLHVVGKAKNEALFVFKIDAKGSLLWGLAGVANAAQEIVQLTPLPNGNVLASGFFGGELDIGPKCKVAAQGFLDAFVAELAP